MYLSFAPEPFACQHPGVVRTIFDFIISELSQGAPLPPLDTVRILRGSDGPVIFHSEENEFTIYLDTSEDYWCQYAYQFAHEFCHYLIRGTFEGGLKGLMWFEETICELSSRFVLLRLSTQWSNLFPGREYYQPAVKEYFEDLVTGSPITLTLPLSQYEDRHSEALRLPVYHRGLYSEMAQALLPVFVSTPSIFLLLPNFGNLHAFPSLKDWLPDLQDHIPTNLRPEFDLLSSALLPRNQKCL